MSKTVLITGSTDGIGFETAKLVAAAGHRILLHGRNPAKLDKAKSAIEGDPDTFVADLSRLADVTALAADVAKRHGHLDVLINNAGVYKTSESVTQEGLDVRFVVNTIAPYVLTRRLLPLMDGSGRIINVSSAAQAPIDMEALKGNKFLSDMDAYAQSKLAITVWSRELARELQEEPIVVAVNPGSLLASKMVKEGFGVAGNDLKIGADILCNAALDSAFANASGKYFDNDAGKFAMPHAAALDKNQSDRLMSELDTFADQA